MPLETESLILCPRKAEDAKECYQLSACTPKFEDLWFRQTMMADPETMAYNHTWGGTISFPEEHWKAWYEHWIVNHENKRYYRYLKAEGFIGEIAYHYDDERLIYIADVLVYAPYRKKGYGGKWLALLCDAAKENGIAVLYDDIAADNPAVTLFLKNGFAEEYRTDEIIMLKKVLNGQHRSAQNTIPGEG